MKNFVSHPYSSSFIKGIRAIPCPYHNYYFFTKEQLEEELEQFKTGTVRGEVVSETEKELFELYSHEELQEKPEQLSKRGGAKYSDAACNLIQSIYNNTGRHSICRCFKQWHYFRFTKRKCSRGCLSHYCRWSKAISHWKFKVSYLWLCSYNKNI